ncbi:Dna Endonuclease Rbbp8 [Manis pentadactyla]|nr:Dna Endonuclease Rbbp8 [Manis pentadactyla]
MIAVARDLSHLLTAFDGPGVNWTLMGRADHKLPSLLLLEALQHWQGYGEEELTPTHVSESGVVNGFAVGLPSGWQGLTRGYRKINVDPFMSFIRVCPSSSFSSDKANEIP